MAKSKPSKPEKKATESVKKVTDQSTKEIRWTPAKQALVNALKKLGATKATSAVAFETIVKTSKIEEASIKHQLNPKWDISVQEFIIRIETEEGFKWYLGTKGVKLKFEDK